jgi:hypothetical protein
MQSVAPPRTVRPGLSLWIALAGAGAAACTISSDDKGGFSFHIGANAWNLRHHATEERREPLDVRAGDTLVLEGVDGDVLVRATDAEPAVLIALLGADGRTAEEAEAALAATRLEVARSGNEVRVTLRTEPRAVPLGEGVTLSLRPHADLRAVVPTGVRVRARDASGEIEVQGPVADVEARTSFGAVRLSRVTGRAVASSGSGEIVIRDASGGDVHAQTNFGDVTIEDVEAGTIEAESSSGDLLLRSVRAARIDARSSFGGVELERVSGDVTAKTASGDVELADGAPGTHRLHSNFGTVSVERVSGVIRASSDSGNVEVEADGDVEATSGYGRVRVAGVLTHLHATSDAGDVDVVARAGSAPAAEWRITSRFGEVALRAAPDLACTIDARTEFGDVSGDVGLTVEEDGAATRASGALGAGGPAVVLRTSSGDVEVRWAR